MRYLWLLSLLLLSGCYYPYGPSYGYGGYPYPGYPSHGYAPGAYGSGPPPPSYSNQQPYPGAQQPYQAYPGTQQPYQAYPGAEQPYYGNTQPGYAGPAASDPNNCGTPDEPRPCHGTYR